MLCKIMKGFLGLLLLVILLIGGFIAYKQYEYRPDKACFARDVVVVKLGETVLAVPREYRPVFHAPEGKQIPYADKLTMLHVCQRENDPPLEVRSIRLAGEGKFQFLALNINPIAITDKVLTDHHEGRQLLGLYVSYQPQSRTNYQKAVKQELLRWEQKAQQIINSAKSKE